MQGASGAMKYDIIVIGSGIGGLTTASLMAQVAKKRVLVLEKHFKPGGLTHTFRRKEFEWDVGLHYVGNMHAGSMSRMFSDLVTGHQVQWRRISEPYDTFEFPDGKFSVPSGEQNLKTKLKLEFPHAATGLDRYFQLLNCAANWATRSAAAKTMPSLIGRLVSWPGKSAACCSTKKVLDSLFEDEKLKSILAGQWGDYGLPPSQSAFACHALIARDYMDGAYYPVGGSGVIAPAVQDIIRSNGGDCLVGHDVKRIEVAGRKVVCVVAQRKGSEVIFKARQIVSAVGAAVTFNQLLPEFASVRERKKLSNLSHRPPPTALTLFVGLRASPTTIGISEGNRWIFSSRDFEAIDQARKEVVDGHIQQCFVSFPSLRNPGVTSHTAELITFCDYPSWENWQTLAWKRRGEEYEAKKQRVANAMLELVEQYHPGFRELVCYQELATPLTVESMAGHPRGGVYGLAATPERYKAEAFPIKTSISNLTLTGCDVLSVGINGAMMGGVLTAARLLGPIGFPRLLRAARLAAHKASNYGTRNAANE